jgi:hypothetical protein
LAAAGVWGSDPYRPIASGGFGEIKNCGHFAPALANLITLAILMPPLIGESAYRLWLLIKSVNIDMWNERTSIGFGKGVAGST